LFVKDSVKEPGEQSVGDRETLGKGDTMLSKTGFRLVLTVITLTAVASGSTAQTGHYEGHKVARIEIQTPDQLRAIEDLTPTPDFWTHGRGVGTVEVQFAPDAFAEFQALEIPHRVVIEDVQALVDAERARLAGGNPEAPWYEDYKTLAEINTRVDTIVAAHPNIASVSVIGQSLEGRDIRAIRITGSGVNPGRLGLLFDGCQHAREWVSPMTVTYLAETLMNSYGVDPRVTAMLDASEVFIVPVVNPDGYEYTWTNQRLWRKNRRNNGDGTFGVDLNRNWGFQWGGSGSSGTTSSQIYRGTSAFSEPETRVVRDFFNAHPNIVAHIDFHSYSQLILSPWGYTTSLPPNQPEFDELNALMAGAIAGVHGTAYFAGPTGASLYLAAGVMPDWVFGAAGGGGTKAWTIELRPSGAAGGGFVLPPAQIIPTAEENFEAVVQLGLRMTTSLALTFETQLPGRIPSGQDFKFVVNIVEVNGTLAPGSGTLMYRSGTSGSFASSTLVALGGDRYEATLPAGACGDVTQFYIEASSAGGQTVMLPPGGATSPAELLVSDVIVRFADDGETNAGWQVGFAGDTATTGIWNRMNPEGTGAQPEDDHTPAPGTDCWVTDGRAGTGIGALDVDGGATTLVSPAFDASEPWEIIGGEAYLTYHRWYSNDQGGSPAADSMPILISNDGGQTWTQLEDVTENAGRWVAKTFKVSNFVAPTADMRVRFVARDDGAGSIVEAAIDDITLEVFGCTRHPADFNKDGVLDIFDFLAFQNLFVLRDPRADLDQSTGVGVFDIFDFLEFQRLFIG
jgi:zinc carboxypeptidase/carboxypeptidase activation peptide